MFEKSAAISERTEIYDTKNGLANIYYPPECISLGSGSGGSKTTMFPKLNLLRIGRNLRGPYS